MPEAIADGTHLLTRILAPRSQAPRRCIPWEYHRSTHALKHLSNLVYLRRE